MLNSGNFHNLCKPYFNIFDDLAKANKRNLLEYFFQFIFFTNRSKIYLLHLNEKNDFFNINKKITFVLLILNLI